MSSSGARSCDRVPGDILRGMTKRVLVAITLLLLVSHVQAQTPANLAALDAETLQHFQALLKTDTQSPPGNEIRAVEYLKQVLDKEGIAYQVFAKDPQRPNLVARIKGNGKKKPILIMGHTDVVTVDAKKWTFPPFGAVRDGGYVYGRGAVDDKDNLTAALMLILRLKREGTPLDRDVILLAESGEEGAPDVGAQFMADNHFDAINAEFCFAEGGGVVREGGTVRQANVGTTEKEPRPIEIIARGPAGHGSVPSKNNAVTHLSAAVGKIANWVPPLRINETTGAYFRKMQTLVTPEVAKVYRDVLSPDPKINKPAAEWLLENQETFLDEVRKVIGDPSVEVRWFRDRYRPAGGSRLDTEAFTTLEAQLKKHYDTVALPTMGTGATDMSNIRAKGPQCYGIGPAIDTEDGPKGFGAHSDQERILEAELFRFTRFTYDLVVELSRAGWPRRRGADRSRLPGHDPRAFDHRRVG